MSKSIDYTTLTACGECCAECAKKKAGICQGCIEADGYVSEWAGSGRCKVHACTRAHGVSFCGVCPEFPCKDIHQIIHWKKDVVEQQQALADGYRQEVIPLAKNIEIRKLKIEELSLLTQLFDYNDIDDMILENTENMKKGSIDIFCVFHDNRLLGELHVSYEDEDKAVAEKGKRAYLFAFRVHKDFQGQGIGTRLLESVIDRLAADGYHEFTVGVEDDNIRARHMYVKQGFCTTIARKQESYQGDSYEYDLLFYTFFRKVYT